VQINMEQQIKILGNENEIHIDQSCYADQPQTAKMLGIRFLFSGKEEYTMGKRNLVLFPGYFFVINEGTSYKRLYRPEKNNSSIGLTFSNQFLAEFKDNCSYKDNHLLSAYSPEEISKWNIADKLYTLSGDMRFSILHFKDYLEKGGNDEPLLLEYMHHCLLNCYMIHSQENLKAARQLKIVNAETKEDVFKRLGLAKEYLQANYQKNVRLADIADYSCFSVNHLIRMFQQAYNQTPYQYLIELRLQRSRTLLKDTYYPVNEIGNIVGFESTSSFIRLFKEHFNITPLKFRCVVA
jgi:AraC family transcriptional regulator